jgi:hypothetical protein
MLIHILAATLWVLALLFAMATQNRLHHGDRGGAMLGLGITLTIAVVAFILQIL